MKHQITYFDGMLLKAGRSVETLINITIQVIINTKTKNTRYKKSSCKMIKILHTIKLHIF